ncbi:MAG TPA: helix-turn-helix domain-containing protein [Patescibacteria group bacterium]|nr:helix-turn-helix domain-containing protein [Patescibacteria group bacterium]
MINKGFCINSTKAIPSIYNNKQFYFMPNPILRKYVSHYTFSYSVANYKEHVKGTAEELILIPAGGGCMIFSFDGGELYESCWGPTSKPVKVQKDDSTKDKRMFFIEFLPGGLYEFTGIPQNKLRDVQCSLFEIEKELTRTLRTAVMTSRSVEEIIFRTDNILIRALENKFMTNASVISVLNKIKQSGGQASIKSLAASEYISERHLNRLFENSVGISVKTYERLVRINRAVKLYKNNTLQSVSHIAQESGFFDESHFIRDFNEFCNATPNTFVKKVSDFYNEPFK